MFIVRDWDEDEFELGIEGGKQYITTLLKPSETKDDNGEHNLIKIFLEKSFSNIDCALLPHPGLKSKKNNAQVFLAGKFYIFSAKTFIKI